MSVGTSETVPAPPGADLPVGNLDPETVEGFGREWARYDQSALDEAELDRQFAAYFSRFPWDDLPPDARGFDAGCGTGRWARRVAPRVGTLHCVDASPDALAVARRNLRDHPNCELTVASLDSLPLPDASMDFGYSLGVLHHVPDPAAGLAACVRKLRAGAPFGVYIYYAFDNRAPWFRRLWQASDLLRRAVSRLPHRVRPLVTEPIALLVYWPLARTAKLLERLGLDVDSFPLAGYRDRALYSMRTDALDRFGTPLEHRFGREEIRRMMEAAGLERIEFSDSIPYWCAVGYRRGTGA